jgi:colanic acid/amylovoran biosynthesis glycosyltransferase
MTLFRTPRVLLYFSPLAVTDPDAESLGLPRKFLDGFRAFAERWDGELVLMLPRARRRDDNLDYVFAARRALGFTVRALPDDMSTLREGIQSAALVYALLMTQYVPIAALCQRINVPVVCDADVSPEIREAIVCAQTRNPFLRWRRLLWLRQQEPRLREMLGTAAGAQFLGTPAYDAYAALNRAPLLYFDTRVRCDMLANAEQLRTRLARLRSGAALRLIFSGRWIAIKGVQDLPRVALDLREMGVPFEMDIFGGGALDKPLRDAIARAQLANVRVRGELPFPDLMQFAANECDLFICCHRQGDPSGTFVEMMSVGVPIAGYDQSGLRGLVKLSHAGIVTPPDNPRALAEQIAAMHHDREQLRDLTRAAVAFTRDKSFEAMMARRVAHLDMAAKSASA